MRKYYDEVNEEYERGYRDGRKEALRSLDESLSEDAADYQNVTYKYKSLLQYYEKYLSALNSNDIEINPSFRTKNGNFTDTEKETRQLVYEVEKVIKSGEDPLLYQIFITLELPYYVEIRIFDHKKNKNLKSVKFDVLKDSIDYIKSVVNKG